MEQWKVWKHGDNFGLFSYAQRLASLFGTELSFIPLTSRYELWLVLTNG